MTALSTSQSLCKDTGEHLLDIGEQQTKVSLGRKAMAFQHALCGHPLLAIDAIAALADSLAPASIECLDGKQTVLAPGGEPVEMANRGDAVRALENNGQWMVIKNVERNADYRALVDELLDQVAELLPTNEGRMVLREAFIFLSAPGSVTPVHIDPEHNFLLHLQGEKSLSVGQFSDRVAEQRAVRRYLSGGHRNLTEMPLGFERFELHPGCGVYMPPWRPHWVKNGEAFCISLSIAFRTQVSERFEFANMINIKLERLGLSPKLVGDAVWRDRAKAGIVRAKRWLRGAR